MNSKNQSSKILNLLLAFCLLIQTPIQAQDNPKNTIEKAGSQIISILKNKSLKKNVKKERISKIFYQTFSRQRMAQAALRSNYKKLTDPQKKEFSKLFARFILEFYLDKMDLYNNNKLIIREAVEKRKGKIAVVKTGITLPNGNIAEIDYSLYNEPSVGWQVYDFEIEGVRMSTTYYSQLASIYKKGKYKGLKKELNRLINLY